MRPSILLLGLPLLVTIACVPIGCEKSPQSATETATRDGRIVGKWQETDHGEALELMADGTGEMKDKSGSVSSFSWATEGEKITVRSLSAPSASWPPKEGSYFYLYHASEQILGAAYVEIRSQDGNTKWNMDRP
jgi:hypothetical protein